MATVPSGTRFIGIATTADLVERKSAVLNSQTQPFTIEDIASSVTTASQGPQGVPGVQGEQGIPGTAGAVGPAGLNWQSTWVSGTSYVADDAVAYDGASWFCILATSGTTAPDLDATHWALLASQGAQGIQGIQGIPGQQGIQGIQGSPAAQTLQETINLGNTINNGSYVTTISADNISNEKIGTGVSSIFSYEGLDLLKSGEVLKIQAPDILTDSRNIKFPDASGIIALLSDIPSATIPTLAQVLTAGNVVLDTNATFLASYGAQTLISPGDLTVIYGSESADLYPSSLTFGNSNGSIQLVPPGTITGAPTVTLPNATGTVALTSDVTLQKAINGGNTITSGTQVNTISHNNIIFSNSSTGFSSLYGNGTSNKFDGSGNSQTLRFPTTLAGGIKTITLPNADGTVALTSDVTLQKAIAGGNIVPFDTIWNTNGANNVKINTTGIKFDSPFTTSYGIFSKGEMLYSDGTSYIAIKTPTTISGGNKTITFPNATGTVALQNYKSYVALISQSGTSAPTATVVFNDTAATFTWSYDDVGSYFVTCSSPILLSGKTVVFVTTQGNPGNSQNKIFGGTRSNDSTVSLFTSTNGILDLNLEIRVYN